MKLNIVCIPGDGIGPEIVTQAKKVLEKVAAVYGHEMVFTDILMGGASIDACGEPLTQEAIDTAYENAAKITFENAYYRTDIGAKALKAGQK